MSQNGNFVTTPPSSEEIAAVAAVRLGQPIRRVTRLLAGKMTLKYELEMAQGQLYILRIYPKSRTHVVKFEPDIILRCSKIGLKVPEIVADSRDEVSSRFSYILYRYIDGVSLDRVVSRMTAQMLEAVCDNVLQQLDGMSTIELEGFGEPINALAAACTSFKSFVETSIETGVRAVHDYCLLEPEHEASLLQFIRAPWDANCGSSGTLAWADVSPENIMVDGDFKFLSLLDFESALSAPVELNLGYCYARERDSRFQRIFHDRWNRQFGNVDRELRNKYAILRLLRLAPHMASQLPTGENRERLSSLLPGSITALTTMNENRSRHGG